MIHIVSGMYRSGTSAMMQALIAGGMSAEWSAKRDHLIEAHGDEHYKPNPTGLYEVPLSEYSGLDFPLAYQGKLIKVMLWGLNTLAVNPEGYRIIIMRRDPEEIRQSYEAFFGTKSQPLTDYYKRIERAQSQLLNRKDVFSVTVIDYKSLIEHTEYDMVSLHNDGWPIDPFKAASVIDQAQYRFRKELLTVGI